MFLLNWPHGKLGQHCADSLPSFWLIMDNFCTWQKPYPRAGVKTGMPVCLSAYYNNYYIFKPSHKKVIVWCGESHLSACQARAKAWGVN